MENKINIGDQNIQQIGQNSVDQQKQIVEKQKINYWMVSTIALVALLVLAVTGGGYYLYKINRSNANSIKTVETPNTPTPASTSVANQTFSDNTHVKFVYPGNWRVGKFEHFPDMYTLQPTDIFVSESQTNSILISINNLCLNTQCLTVFNLDEMVKNINAKVISQAKAGNVNGYKVTLSDGKVAYVFIQGPDFVIINTDKYASEMDQLIPTLQLLASASEETGETKSYNSGNFTFKYPKNWKVSTKQIEYYDSPTLELTKISGTKMAGGYELPEIWIGSFEIYSTSGAICANEPECPKVDTISFTIKSKNYSTDVFRRQIWESGKFTGKYFYVFQIGSQSELDSIPSKPVITGQYETTADKQEIENILSSMMY